MNSSVAMRVIVRHEFFVFGLFAWEFLDADQFLGDALMVRDFVLPGVDQALDFLFDRFEAAE